MRRRSLLGLAASAAISIAVLLPAGALGFPEGGLFGHLAKAANIVVVAAGKWNEQIDKLIDNVARSQLRDSMVQLHKDMNTLITRKEELLDSIKERRTFEISADVNDIKNAVHALRASLDTVGTELSIQDKDGQKFQEEIELDLKQKMDGLISLGLSQGNAESQDKYAKRVEESLDLAIEKLKAARKVVGQCLQKLK